MKRTCPRCGAKGIAVGLLDCLSNASFVLPRKCASCNGSVKRRWFSWQSLVAGFPMALGAGLGLLQSDASIWFASFFAGAGVTMLLHGFWVPFAPWSAPRLVLPVVIPPADDA